MVFSVSPRKYSTTSDDRIASGIEIITTSVDRQDPRKIRIISAVRPAAMAPSRSTPVTEFVTNTDWSNSSLILRPAGAAARIASRAFFTPLTTASVEALPFLITLSKTERRPSSRTMFCCTSDPSRTCATSFKKMVAPLANLTGIMLRSLIVAGVALVRTVYWVSPIFAVPDGSVRFCVLTAFTMSSGVSPRDRSLSGSISTMIWRYLPPAGVGKRDAGNRRQLLPDAIDAEIVELLLVQAVRIQAELQDRNARCIELHDDRRLDAGRHQGANGIRGGDDLRDGEVEIDVRLEVDLLDRQTVKGLRFHVLDAVDVGADGILAVGADALFHFRRGEAGVLPDDRHHRNADFRKNIRRHRPDRGDAEKQDQGRQHIERVRKPQRKTNNAHIQLCECPVVWL